MRKTTKELVSLILIVFLIISLTACSSSQGTSSTGSDSNSSNDLQSGDASSDTASEGNTEDSKEFSYPMDGSVTLTWWIPANAELTGEQQQRENNPIMKWLSEATGVKFEFQHPPIGEERNAFNILCASGDIPDIVSYDVNNYTGGMQKAVDDGIALRLNDYIPKYCPNLQAFLDENPEFAQNMKTPNGDYCYFPKLTLDPFCRSWFGWQIRADMLEEQGLEPPVTMEDWYNTLSTLKKAYNLEAGLVIMSTAWSQGEMATAYRTALTYDINDAGEVVFGPATQEYKAFLTEMNKWFKEGILHPDFATMDNITAKSYYNSGKAAAIVDSVGSMSGFISAGQTHDPDFATMGCPYPVLNKGDKPYRGYLDTTMSRYCFIGGDIDESKIEAACRFLDFGYSEEGKILYNFGKEGESFNYVDGKPVYTDLIMNNPDGLNKNSAIRLYTMAAGAPSEQLRAYMEQNNNLDCQIEAINNWMNTDQDKHQYPTFAKGTAEEEERLSILNTDINTYVEEMRVKFIMGTESLDNFDKYVENLKNMGLDEALQLKRDIYERYMANISK